ncbi:MAG: response regulator [Chloroflexi bacterium]|nr:response regulator [Chloroflexota bacterium]MDA1219707.1 response regulator [Chloroflexota bacterium]
MVHAVIAEDDAIVRKLLEEIVSILGWGFDSVANGAQALSAVERVMPDVVISDVNMPVMTGIGLVRAIKGNPSLSQIPVVLLSSVDRESAALENGADAFVAKPFTVDTLLKLLPQLISAGQSD